MSTSTTDASAELQAHIKTLSETVWENRCKQPDIDLWLSNFTGLSAPIEQERLNALHLLASLSYFGLREVRELLRALYRGLYRYPMIQGIRTDLGGSTSVAPIHARFEQALNRTRFLGMGNPAESGTHLLYYFRQENQLHRSLFMNEQGILTGRASDLTTTFTHPSVEDYVFIDDLCGSGEQSINYSRTLLADMRVVAKREAREVRASYFVLFGRRTGMERASMYSDFDRVEAVHVLEDSDEAFSANSRIYKKPPTGVSRVAGEAVALHYGTNLWPAEPLGFDDGQLLLAFHHNVPDNTLPIFWFDEAVPAWNPIFPRYPKV